MGGTPVFLKNSSKNGRNYSLRSYYLEPSIFREVANPRMPWESLNLLLFMTVLTLVTEVVSILDIGLLGKVVMTALLQGWIFNKNAA